ncbi:LysR family transcriptional regulator [Rhodococcus tukisamuensis]|uniref:DNA-binding transcriptional regulator, LysR family n=1 Tax=Rhodococcus tukisamuensis TaxID=168276 RepID=A0A1G6U404_9NOCA|nr:LysR family transcriptional regulator [Rhodococcus tukisamuensis]SDD36130.1 DNA-binding transcriptional regulator, LysR family [Rhodococcus tukisamuensis]
MELRQLEYLVAVAEECNFTRAAERMHVSQSGISAQIRQLERDLGAQLIDRSSRTATLTAAGKAAIAHARAALTSAEAVRQAVDEVTTLIRGRLVVGMVTACTVTGLFDALAAFHTAHPGVEITLVEDGSDRLADKVRSGAVDLALVGSASAPPPGLDALQIVSERLVVAAPPGHPLTGLRRVRIEDLARHPIVCMPKGTGIRTVFDQACAAVGARPEIALQASAPDAVADLATRGLGVAILSESMAGGYGGLVARVIDDVGIPAVLALVWGRTGTPALREFVWHCRLAFGEGPTPA